MKEMKETFLANLHAARVSHGRALARLMRSRRRGDAECEAIDRSTLKITADEIRYWSQLIKEFCR